MCPLDRFCLGCFLFVEASAADQHFFEILKWAIANGNAFFKLLYNEGIWIHADRARIAVFHGYEAIDAWCRSTSVFHA